MFRNAALLALVFALIPQSSAAQDLDLDDILAHYYEAIGGLAAWKSVESMKVTGKMSMRRGMEVPFTRLVKRPGRVRMEFTVQGMTAVRAFDGETGWMIMPFRGTGEPERMEGAQMQGLRDDADIDGLLVGYEEDGYEVELVGLEETEGTQAFKLMITKKEGDVEYWFLDAEYFIPIKTEVRRSVRGAETEVEVIISDYKEVNGLMMAHSFQSRRKGQDVGQSITFERVELNIDIDDAVFRMPEKE